MQDVFFLKEFAKSFAREPECEPKFPARYKDMAVYIPGDCAKTISEFQLVSGTKIWTSIV